MNSSSEPRSLPPTADYGIDAPGQIRAFFLMGVPAVIVGLLIPAFRLFGISMDFVSPVLFLFGLGCLTLGACMVAYGLRGKFNIRRRMLDFVDWRGDENVLDVGTGRGFLLTGAAQRLTTGTAIGIDIWNAADLSGNYMENAQRNLEIEGVTAKTELRHEDVRALTFADNSFDVILSLLCLHNIEAKKERETACQEIARVLKPGGTALIGDYILTAEYAAALAKAGLSVQPPQSYLREAYGLMWIVIAKKE